MVFCKYRLADAVFLCGWPNAPDFDPVTEGVETYLESARPDLRLHRYDGTVFTKMRLATAQELAAYDAARLDERAQIQFDDQKLIKAVAIWAAQKFGVTGQTAKQEILVIYKSLS